ncbi:DUF2939 domain-containing protein [Phenylobacterium sp.]|uniref:DUF2939 domain-containing protein n=1 Tax=Phenylobacterium sp. TaxID=1871053 RepID=UPI00286A7363|nr:DUF2939 domain-containing protein [Phenylobacterium sp.]
MALILSYIALPVSAAVSLTGAVQRLDMPALVDQLDWSALRADVHEELVRDAEQQGPVRSFIDIVAATMAVHLASPKGSAALLNDRPASRADSTPPLVRTLAPLGLTRWRTPWCRPKLEGTTPA